MTDPKDTNPKDAVGTLKVPMSCVPLRPLMELGLAMLEGARKYGRHNYRAVGVRASVYFDAFCRHVFAWWEGEDVDPDSGVHHLIKAMACLAVVRDAEIQGLLTDDRPPKVKPGWVNELNTRAKAIIERIPDAKEPFVIGTGTRCRCGKVVPAAEIRDGECWVCWCSSVKKHFGLLVDRP